MKYLFLAVPFFLALLSWLIPNYYQPWLGVYPNSLAFTAYWLLFIWVLINLPLQGGKELILLPTVLLIIITQYLFGISIYLGEVLVVSLFIIAFVLSYLTGLNFSVSDTLRKNFTKSLAILFILGALISGYIALLQWQQLNNSIWIRDMAPGGRPYANFGQPNNLATALCLGLAGVLYLFETRILQRICTIFISLFILFALALAQSRTTWLVGIIVIIFWAWKSRYSDIKPRLSTCKLLLWYLLFMIIVALLPWLNQLLLISTPDLLVRVQEHSRVQLWQQMGLAILNGPWYGYGVGQVAEAQISITNIFSTNGLMSFYAHNILLDILVWFGFLFGFLLIILMVCGLFCLFLKAYSIESRFALVVALCILTHSMLEYPHAYLFFLLPLGAVLGIAAADLPKTRLFRIPKAFTLIFATCIAAIAAWIMYEYIVIEQDFRLLRFESANIGTVRAEQAAPDVLLLDNLREYTRLARTDASDILGDEQLVWAQQVAHHYPYPSSLIRYIQALAINGKVEKAVNELLILDSLHGSKYSHSVLYWLRAQPNNSEMESILLQFEKRRPL